MIEQLAIFGLGLLNISYAISMIICGKILFSGYGIGSVLIGGVFLIIPLSIVLISLRLIKTFYKEMSIKDLKYMKSSLISALIYWGIIALTIIIESHIHMSHLWWYGSILVVSLMVITLKRKYDFWQMLKYNYPTVVSHYNNMDIIGHARFRYLEQASSEILETCEKEDINQIIIRAKLNGICVFLHFEIMVWTTFMLVSVPNLVI
jgi:hypothetical protein